MGLYVAPKLLFSKIIPDVGFYDFKGKSIRNVDKFTCNDYFGAFVSDYSDSVRGSVAYDGVTWSTKGHRVLPGIVIPSVYGPNSKVKIKIDCMTASAGYGAAYVNVQKNGVYWFEVKHSIHGGLQSPRSIASFNKTVNPLDVITIDLYIDEESGPTQEAAAWGMTVCCDDSALNLDLGFSWDDWQEST